MPTLTLDYDSLFQPQFNYSAADIAAKTGLNVDLVRAAAERREISSVITMARDGVNKMYKGHKVVAWLRRRAAQQTRSTPSSATGSPQENPAQ